MAGTGSHSGSGVGDAVRKGVGLVHGTGEAIRGNINAAVDTASGDRQSAARHQNIASRGVDEMEHGHYHGTGAGVTPADTDRERQNRVAQGEYGYDGSTNYGPHSSNVGNKVDPRYDSDMDHRGTMHGSTNYGPHSTNVGNKMDPRFDSDVDHRGTAQGSTNYGPHATNVGNKIDPRYDSDMDHRGTTQGSTNYGPHSTNVGNQMDPRFDSDQDHRGAHHGGSTNYGPHSTNVANKLDPRYDSDLDHRGERFGGSTNYGPHSTNTGNKLDPRYDSDLDNRGPGAHDDPTHRQHQPRHQSSILNILDTRADSGLGTPGFSAAFFLFDLQRPVNSSACKLLTRPLPQARRSSHEESLPRTPTYASPRRVDSAPNPAPHIHHEHQCPRDDEDVFEREYRDRHGSTTTKTQHALHSNRTANVLDPRVGAAAPKAEPHSTVQPHNSGFLNLLDPRVDRNAAKQYQASDDNA